MRPSPRTVVASVLCAAAALAAAVPLMSARAQTPTSADPGLIAKQIQDGCVARRQDPRVCACGVGVAYAKLEPNAFALIPKIDPILDETDRTKQISGLIGVASNSHMSIQQVQSAYETIRANRAVVRAVCNPLGAARK